jgi:hypothetical protein
MQFWIFLDRNASRDSFDIFLNFSEYDETISSTEEIARQELEAELKGGSAKEQIIKVDGKKGPAFGSQGRFQNGHLLWEGQNERLWIPIPWECQMFVLSTMVFGLLARSEAIEAAVFVLSTTGRFVGRSTQHEMNSARRSLQWTKI